MIRILVAHEHHGDRYFEATTDTQLTQVCCRLLRERLADGYYAVDTDAAINSIDSAVIAGLPRHMRDAAENHNRNLVALAKESQRGREFLASVARVLSSPVVLYCGHSKAQRVRAWELLRSRKDAESEDVSLCCLEQGSETNRPEFISEELHFRMEQEGWAIFYSDSMPQVMRLADRGILATDAQAIVLARKAGLAVGDDGLVDLTRSDKERRVRPKDELMDELTRYNGLYGPDSLQLEARWEPDQLLPLLACWWWVIARLRSADQPTGHKNIRCVFVQEQQLLVDWTVAPSREQMVAWLDGWATCYGDGSCVVHLVNGV